MREFTIIEVDDGPAWVLFRNNGQVERTAVCIPEGEWVALEYVYAAREVKSIVQTSEEVCARWNEYCNHHEWNQDPSNSSSWEWKEIEA